MYGFLRGLYACVTGLILRAENYGVVTPFYGVFTYLYGLLAIYGV